MKKGDILKCIGILIYIALTFTDKLFAQVPDGIYILVALLGAACIVLGFVQEKRSKKQ